MSVSDALRLHAELPALARLLADGEPRSPAQREHRREAGAALDRLILQLRERLRPFCIPETDATDEQGG
jgi:hypothetical protein